MFRFGSAQLSAKLAVASLAAALGLTANSAKAAPITCTFGTLAACNVTVNNLTFSNFAYNNSAGGNIESSDLIEIDGNNGTFTTIDFFFDRGSVGTLLGQGTISFKVTTDPGLALLDAETSAVFTNNFLYTTTATGLTTSPLGNVQLSNFNTGVTSSDVLVTWNAGSGSSTAYGLELKTTPYTAPVPGPIPLFGAAAAFSVSRKLRRRIHGRV